MSPEVLTRTGLFATSGATIDIKLISSLGPSTYCGRCRPTEGLFGNPGVCTTASATGINAPKQIPTPTVAIPANLVCQCTVCPLIVVLVFDDFDSIAKVNNQDSRVSSHRPQKMARFDMDD